MTTTVQRVTAEDLLKSPRGQYRYELIKGELKKMSPAGHQHGRVVIRITTPLDQHVTSNKLGVVYAAETGFKIGSNPDTVRAPDVAFVRQERVDQVGDAQGFWPGAPDLAVEVVSPSDTYSEVEEKVFAWLEAGTRMVVVANPRKRTLTVYRSFSDIKVLAENDTLAGDEVVPGWKLPLKGLFH